VSAVHERTAAVLRAGLRALAFRVAVVFIVVCGSACQSVEPWQREQLSTLRMQREPHGAHAAFLDHVRQSREAATTGTGSGGGGCGCY
jgi:Domain of unknown function (DUF4266)